MARFNDSHVEHQSWTQVATAMSAVSSQAILVDVNGISLTARVVAGVSPALGDVVLIARYSASWYVIAIIPPVPLVAPPPPVETPVKPPSDPSPSPKPTVKTGTLVVTPVGTSTYRDGKWRTDLGNSVDSSDTLQGVWPGYGNNTGCAFYGTKPTSLKGSTVTRVTIKMKRIQAGVFAAKQMTLRLVTQKTRPAGAPTLNESTGGPSLPVNGSTNGFVLPNSWGQALVDGTRGGIACFISSGSPYMRMSGRGSWSSAWVLSISWRRG